VFGTANDDEMFEALGRMRRDRRIEPRRCKADARAGMLEDIAELGAVQLGIGRHSGEPHVPDAEQQFEIGRRILADDGDAVAGGELQSSAQAAGQARGALGQFAVACDDARTERCRRHVWMTKSRAIKPRRDIHSITMPSFRGARASVRAWNPEQHDNALTLAPGFRARRYAPSRNDRLTELHRVEPADADRIALTAEQSERLVERQADDVGVGA